MQPLLIIGTGSTSASIAARFGGFADWIISASGVPPEAATVVDVPNGGRLPAPADISGAVVTGSSAMVTDHEPWSEAAAAWLREAIGAGTPVLGICYGHQLLAHALGGVVGMNPNGREIGTRRVHLLPAALQDQLLTGLDGEILVQTTHLQSVLELPPPAIRLAESDLDPNHAFCVGDQAWGVQFHPEFTDTVMRAYLDERRATLLAEGLDPDALRSATADAGHGSIILSRFAAVAGFPPGSE